MSTVVIAERDNRFMEDVSSVRVAEYLRGAILGGQLPPGTWIRQADVATRLRCSRVPVREALRMLEAEGLTDHEPHRGARVPRLSQHEVEMVYEMRERLESLALADSMSSLDDASIERLQGVQARIEETDDVEEFLDLDREFHMLTYGGCDLEPLMSMVTRLWNTTQHYRRAFVAIGGQGRMWVVNSEHRLLLDAVQRRDTVDGERVLAGHIRRTRIELGHHPELFQDSLT